MKFIGRFTINPHSKAITNQCVFNEINDYILNTNTSSQVTIERLIPEVCIQYSEIFSRIHILITGN